MVLEEMRHEVIGGEEVMGSVGNVKDGKSAGIYLSTEGMI